VDIQTLIVPDLRTFLPHPEPRAEGLHLSDILRPMAAELLPKWFSYYTDEPEDQAAKLRQEAHFMKGLLLEQAWGSAMAQLAGQEFTRPQPRQSEHGVWMSPDGYQPYIGVPELWPYELPLHAPAIHECKVTLKSCKGPITQEKFLPWMWQIKAYCREWRTLAAYLHVCYLLGDYGKRPFTPQGYVYRLLFTQGELDENWDKIVGFAKDGGLL